MALTRLRQHRFGVYALILVVGLVNVISQADFARNANFRSFGDALSYIKMSQHTFASVPNPFAFRLLSPLIVHELQKLPGLGLNSSWLLLTFVATSLALIVFFEILYGHLKLSLFTSVLFTIMLACTFNFSLFNYGDMWLVDPLNNLFYVLALYCLLKRRMWAFMLVILIGSTNKETTVLLAPLYPLLVWVRGGRITSRAVVWSAGAAVGVLAFYLIYHRLVLVQLGSGHYQMLSDSGRTFFDNIRFSLGTGKDAEQLTIFGVFSFMWLVFAYGLYRLYRAYGMRSEWLVLSTYLLATVMFGRLFATDTGRVYVMMAPVVLGVSALVFNGFVTERERLWVGLLAFLYLALNFGWFPGVAALFVSIGALLILGVILEPAKLDYKALFAVTQKPGVRAA